MAYQALYRKWRPETFDEVAGQGAVIKTLKNQIRSGRVGHAYLFCGTRGTGKTTAAKIFARAVNCPHAAEHDGNPCGECEVCQAIGAGRAMNVFEIDAASNNGVDNIRDIRDQVEYPPVTGRYKVYIIDEVHMLSTGAFNALLKTLEEPPSYVIFILATTDPQKVPATVLSRCQRYDFRRMSRQDITARLKEVLRREGIQAEDKALGYIAEAADGSMRDALSITDQCLAYHYGEVLRYDNVLDILGAADTKVFSGLLRQIAAGDAEGTISLIAELIDTGRDISQLVNDFIWHLRNVLLIKSTGNAEITELSEERAAAAAEDAGVLDRDSLIRMIGAFAELVNRIRFSSQKRVQLEAEVIRQCAAGMRTAGARPAVAAAAGMTAGVSGTESQAAGNRTAGASGAGDRPEAAGDTVTAGRNPAAASTIGNTAGSTIGSTIGNIAASTIGSTAGNATASTIGTAVSLEPASAKIHVEIREPVRVQPAVQPQAPDAQPQAPDAQPQAPDAQPQTPDAPSARSVLDIVQQNWSMLVGELSAPNRPLFAGVLLKEEQGNVALVFKNKLNYSLAARNAEENGVLKLRELALARLGMKINFMARIARPGEIDTRPVTATDEELARINFPISYED